MATTSSLSKLTHKKTEKELLIHRINSMCDNDFLEELNDHISIVVITASLREENIASYRRTGAFNYKAKDIHCMKKIGTTNTILEFLNSMDDASLNELVKDSSLKELALSDMSLQQRLNHPGTQLVQNVTKKYKHSPIPLSLDF